nr:hypothetical protein [Leptospira sp. id769339]
MEKEPSFIEKSKNVPIVGKKKYNPEDFLLEKEKSLGKVISPRFRELFYRKLKELKDPESAWRSIYGN